MVLWQTLDRATVTCSHDSSSSSSVMNRKQHSLSDALRRLLF